MVKSPTSICHNSYSFLQNDKSPMRTLFILICSLMLISCGDQTHQTIEFQPPATWGGKLCINQCRTARHYCLTSCDLDQHQCFAKQQGQALNEYDHYTQEQHEKQQPMTLKLHDFEHTIPCENSKKNCIHECKETYQSCYKDYGGLVTTTTSCQLFCF